MDIQATKLQLVQQILNTTEKKVLVEVKQLLDQSDNMDFWNELTSDDQKAIKEGISQLDQGNFYTASEARKKIHKQLNWD